MEFTGVQFEAERALKAKLSHASVLVDAGAASFGCAGETGQEKPGVQRGPGDFVGDAQEARILPGERGMTSAVVARNLPGAGPLEVALDLQFIEGSDKAVENGTESGQGSGSGFI